MKPETIGKLGARDAAIMMGVNAARNLIESFRKDRGEMGMDAAAEAAGEAMGRLRSLATALIASPSSKVSRLNWAKSFTR